MRCDEVQNELACESRESMTSALTAEVQNHLQGCAGCRRVQLLYSRMDDSLRRNFVWQPPEGFVETIVACATSELQNALEPPRILAWDVFRKAVFSLLLIAVMYAGVWLLLETSVRLAAAMAANALLVSWGCAAMSLGISFWFTRRALR